MEFVKWFTPQFDSQSLQFYLKKRRKLRLFWSKNGNTRCFTHLHLICILIKLSVFLQISTQIQSHSSYFVKIQPGYGNFHSNNHFFALVLKNLPKPRNFNICVICDKFHVWLSISWDIDGREVLLHIHHGRLRRTIVILTWPTSATILIWMYFSMLMRPGQQDGANMWQFMTDKPVLSCFVTYCTNAFWDDLTFLRFTPFGYQLGALNLILIQ